MDARLTIALPVKSPDYFVPAFRSVLRQSRPDWRLVVYDDGCPDPIVRETVQSTRDARVSYARNETSLGMVGSWNRCLELAPGEFVTILHADDQLKENYCETILRAADEHPDAVAFFTAAEVVRGDGKRIFSFPDWYKQWLLPSRRGDFVVRGDAGVASLLRGNYIFCPTLCFRTARLRGRRFPAAFHQAPDLAFTLELLLAGEHLVGSNTVAYTYRRHEQAATTVHTRNLVRFREELRIYDDLLPRLEQLGYEKSLAVARRRRIIKMNLAYCILADLAALRFEQARAKAGLLGALARRGSPAP